ncbi:hypothetical protein C8R48DRAFT_777751 [Suillus tomentosus]|nr:hypothetical protein C8R48DRAFT_777751 [Suillus tomentosus]
MTPSRTGKRMALPIDEPPSKRIRNDSNGTCAPSPLEDAGTWSFLERYLKSELSYGQAEEGLISYLGNRYREDDWREAKLAVFSGDGDDYEAMNNLMALKRRYIPEPSVSSSTLVATFASKRKRVKHCIFIDREAGEGVDDEEEEEEEEEEEGYEYGLPARPRQVTTLPGPSAKHMLSKRIDEIFNAYDTQARASRPPGRLGCIPYRAAWSSDTIDNRMYLLNVHRTVTDYVAERLRSKKISVIVSPWVPGQLYVVSESPRAIASSLPTSHRLSVKDYFRISDEERAVVEHPQSQLPSSPGWVRIIRGKYKNAMAYVTNLKPANESPSGHPLVWVLVALRDFPYPMPKGSVALLDRSRLPTGNAVSDIIRDGKVVGCLYKGEEYYQGLLLKSFHRDLLNVVETPHPDEIRLHIDSGWDRPSMKIAERAFSLEFLRVGDSARVIIGEFGAEIGEVVSTDHTFRSVRLEYNIEGDKIQSEVRLQDVERMFWVGDTVRVVAGIYLGLEGHIVQMTDDIFHICQTSTKEEVEVSKYYLDRRSLKHTLQAQLPTQQSFEPPPDPDDIQIGDVIQVLFGEHIGKCGIVDWFPSGGTMLWFRDANPMPTTGDDTNIGPPSIQVPAVMVQRIRLPPTIKFTKDRGYDVRPGDVVSVARGPEYEATGIIQSVNVPEACLTILSTRDHTIINVPIRFVMKLRNANVDSFNHVIGKEVFVVGGNLKGYRATLYNIGREDCAVAIHGQKRTTLKRSDVVTSYGMRLNGAIFEGNDLVSFCDMRQKSYLIAQPPRSITPPPEKIVPSSSITNVSSLSSDVLSHWTPNPEDIDLALSPSELATDNQTANLNSSASDPWTINEGDIRDNIGARAEKHGDNGSLSWLMKKEFSSTLLTHHALLKVSPRFEQGRLCKRFVSTACPDPFCGANGPAPEGFVAVFCTSNGAGAQIQHYHVPASDLSPAHPRKKNQHCLVLDGEYRGLILPVSKCNMKSKTVEVLLMTTITATLHFDQICLVELTQHRLG